MGFVFADVVVAGTVLVREAIASPNYAAGLSGWTINADGSAEFNTITIRGTGIFGNPTGQRVYISPTGVIQIYNAANQLVGQWDSGQLFLTDPAGGSSAALTIGANTALTLEPPNQPGNTYIPAKIYSDSGGTDAWLELKSPQVNGGSSSGVLLFAQSATAPTEMHLDADLIYPLGASFPMGRGVIALDWSAAVSAAVTAETVVLLASSFTYEAGRSYEARWGNLVSSSLANGRVGFRLRKTNATGLQLGYTGIISCQTAGSVVQAAGSFLFRNSTAANITAAIALTLQHLDGAANTAQQNVNGLTTRFLQIYDVGDASAFPNASPLT